MKHILSILIFFSAMAVRADVTVSRYNISWTLHGTPTYGTYANGDYWVVGPVDITPNPGETSGLSGTMFNPGGLAYELYYQQGYANNIPYYTYRADWNKSGIRSTVPVNTSVVTCLSTNNPTGKDGFDRIHMYQVLTVVASPPADGSFRPGIYAASKASLFTTNDIDYTKILSLPTAGLNLTEVTTEGGIPISFTAYHQRFDQFLYEPKSDWTTEYIIGSSRGVEQPEDHRINAYGEYCAYITANAAIMLHLNYPMSQKRPLLLGYLQYGLDVYDIVDDGWTWDADGAHHCGRYVALIFASGVFNNASLKSYITGSAQKFQELRQTFILPANCASMPQGQNGNDINTCGAPPTSNHPKYTSDMAGLPEWCFDWANNPEFALNCWDSAYRNQNWGTIAACAMVAHVMNLTSAINYPALLGYTDRGASHFRFVHSTYLTTTFYDVYRNYTAGPDTNAPVISLISTNEITSTNVTVVWTTDEPATSGLLYGTTTNYGNVVTNSELDVFHSLTATGLTAATTYYFKIVSTDSSNNTAYATGSFISLATNFVAIPTITAGTASVAAVSMVMSCATDGAEIRYTRDGTTPTLASELYSAPFNITSNVTIIAVGFKTDFTNSFTVASAFQINDFDVSQASWRNIEIPSKDTNFTITFNVVADASVADMVVGIAPSSATGYGSLACIVRLNNSGFIDCRNGGAYMASNSVPYIGGGVYSVQMDINVTNKTYTVSAGTNGATKTLIWQDAAWRTEQQGATSLSWISSYNSTGTGNFGGVETSGVEPPSESFPPLPPTLDPSGSSFAVVETNVTISVNPTNTIGYVFNGSGASVNDSNAVITVSNGVALVTWATNLATGTGSSEVSRTYTMAAPISTNAAPEFYPPSGTYLDSVTVFLSCNTPGSTIIWTTNYWTSHAVYESPLFWTNSITIISRATNDNYVNSIDSWGIYTITNAPPPKRINNLRAVNTRF